MASIAAADSVTFDANSGAAAAVTTSAAISCTNLILNTGFTGSLTMSNALTVSGTLTHTQGTLNTNGQTWSWGIYSSSNSNTRTLTLGSSNGTITGGGSPWTTSTNTNLTITANTATITFSGAAVTLTPGSAAAGTGTATGNFGGASIVASGSGQFLINGGTSTGFTCGSFTRTGTAAKFDILSTSGPLTCSGQFSCNGNSLTNRVFVNTSVIGTSKTISAATVSLTNTDFMDITGGGAATWTGTSLGNCLGNSNITFDSPVTRYAVVAGNVSSTATWSASTGGAGGSSVPLPQDTVNFDGGSAAGTYTADMPRIGANVDFTNFTRTFSMATSIQTHGSVTLVAGMTFVTGGLNWTVAGRSNHTITSGGKTFGSFLIKGPSSTYSLSDAFNAAGSLNWFNGNFTTNNFNVTCGTYTSNTVNFAKTFTFGSSILTATGTGNVWNWFATNNTITANTATLRITDVSSTAKTFAGADANYNGMSLNVLGSAVNVLNLGTANGLGTGFSNVYFQAPNTITVFSGKTLGFTSLSAIGGAGSVITINTSTGGSAATMSCASGIIACDWLSLKDSTATGGATFYAGINSTNVSGNTGWIFTGAVWPKRAGTSDRITGTSRIATSDRILASTRQT